ncbi:hypothetical protein LJB42_004316 [Komagataella kurtzmanii]|nr:hypothetical protein LJB42_004316 [Komagataella kurtzmanii]
MASNFDDVTQNQHFRSHLEYPVSIIERYTVLLKDGETTATIYPLYSPNELPPGLLQFLCDEFNMEIERGDTFPFFETLHLETFQHYWFGSFAAVMVLGDSPTLDDERQWEKECLGTFYIKANYPGRCSHICTAGFLVNAGIRGKSIGRTLAECFLEWAPRLGYTYAIFNLIFETNVSIKRILESLGFKKIGKIKAAGILKGHDSAVDALILGKELVEIPDPNIGSYRFDKIKYYLETGRYPPSADRQEKSRLRSSASHYRLISGKLMLKGKEVVSDPHRQLQICQEMHMLSHGGINKTTSLITDKYHWSRIKDTVATAIRNCSQCRDQSKIPKRTFLPNKYPISVPKSNATSISSTLDNSRHVNKQNTSESSQSSMQHPRSTKLEIDDQLHQLPSHISRDNVDTSLLSGALSGFDDASNIMAAVELAQRQQHQQQQEQDQQRNLPPHQKRHGKHEQPAEEQSEPQNSHGKSRQQNQANQDSAYYHQYTRDTQDPSDLPVNSQVSNAFDGQVNPGEEINIARALMQATETSVQTDYMTLRHSDEENDSS